jgi:hypothetical protein
MSNPTTRFPSEIAYFEVILPINHSIDSTERAREVVERYLYSGAILQVLIDQHGRDVFVVQVRVEAWTSNHRSFEQQLRNQKDRFLSGGYGSSDPLFFALTQAG